MITVKLTESEAHLINALIDDNIRAGWHYGRLDYWLKNRTRVQLKIEKALREE